jgi:hypothetical protein
MSNIADSLIALKILRMLTQPIENFRAYKLGIVNKNGKEIRKPKNQVEREAYDILDRLVLRLRSIIALVPIENKNFLNYAAAYLLIKESIETENYEDLEDRYIMINENVSEDDVDLSISFMNYVYEDVGGMAIIAGGEPQQVNTTDDLRGAIIPTPMGKKKNKFKMMTRQDESINENNEPVGTEHLIGTQHEWLHHQTVAQRNKFDKMSPERHVSVINKTAQSISNHANSGGTSHSARGSDLIMRYDDHRNYLKKKNPDVYEKHYGHQARHTGGDLYA